MSSGEGPPAVTTTERAERNMSIVTDRARGMSWSRIARNHEVTARHARRVVAEYRASEPSLHEYDPVEIVEETLAAYESAIEDLSLLAGETDHDSTRLGAIKARIDLYHARIELLRMVGVLPSDLGSVRAIIDVRRMATRVAEVFDRDDVPQNLKSDILDAIAPPEGVPSRPHEFPATPNGSPGAR